jgi:ADP-ribosylglycohydrolase
MVSPTENLLSNLLKKRLKTLGYPSLRKFHADRPGMGLSYEILRQVVYGGHVPRPETLFRILGAMQFSSTQVQKICGMHYGEYLPIAPVAASKEPPGGAVPAGDDTGAGRGGDRARQDAEAQAPQNLEEPGEIVSRLRAALPRVPLPGNEDFWELLQAVARVAEQKVRRGVRPAEQPLLFAGEPEAIYQFLVRKGRIPPFLSRGDHLPLGFVDGIPYADRFRGALLGAAVGEALGAVTHGLTPRDIQELYGEVADLPPISAPQMIGAPEPPPQVAVARSLLSGGILEPEQAALALARSVRRDHAQGLVAFARNLLDRGLPWHDAGEGTPESAPAAIALPLVLLRAGNFRRLKLEAGILCAFSHPHPAAIAGTVAFACGVARALHTPAGALDVLSFPRALAPVVAGIEPERAAKARIGRAPAGVGRKLGADLPALLLRRAPVDEMREALGNGPAASEGIPFALGCFLRAPGSFNDVVLPAVGQGGDARVTAALAGALCGAYLGASAIPDRFLARLPFRDELAGAADALLELARRDA